MPRLRNPEKKKATRRWLFHEFLVRPERFERPTPWFVAKYSIQLSYGRLAVVKGAIIQSACACLKYYVEDSWPANAMAS